MSDKWLDAEAAAEKLGYRTMNAFYKAVKAQGIPFVRLGTSLRFSEAKLDAFMDMLSKRPKRGLRRAS